MQKTFLILAASGKKTFNLKPNYMCKNKKVNQNFNARVQKAKQFIGNFDQLIYMFKTLDLMVIVNKTLKTKKNVYNLKVEIKK